MTDQIARLGLEVDADGFVRAKRELRDFSGEAKKAERNTKDFAETARRSGRAVGQALGIIGTAMAGIAANSVRLATSFESELTKINTLVGVSRDEIDGFRDSILSLAPAVGRAPDELARAMFAITSAGARGAAAMELLENASRASAIGLGDTRDIALAAGAAVTAYGEENLNAAQAVEIMVGTIEQGNLEASQLAGVLGRVLGLAAQAGVSFQDAGAFIASFTRQGVDAAQAVTGLRGALQILVRNPPAQATAALNELGLSVEQLRDNVRSQGFINAFQDLVDRADAAGISMGQVIPEVEGLSGVLSVFASQGESAASISESVGDAVGSLGDRFDEAVRNDPSLAFAQIREQLNVMQATIGRALLPSLMMLIQGLQGTGEQAGPLANALSGLATITLRFAQAAVFSAGVLGELGKQAGAAAAFISEAGRSFTDNFRVNEIGEGALQLGGPIRSVIGWLGDLRDTAEVVDESVREDADQMWKGIFDSMESIEEGIENAESTIKGMAQGEGLEQLQASLLAAGQAGLELGEGIEQGASQGADALDELFTKEDEYRRGNEDLAAQLSGEFAVAWLEYERAVQDAWQANNDLEITAETLQERLRLLEQQARATGEAFRADMLAAFQELTGVDLTNLAGTLFGGGGSGGFDFGFISSIGNNFAQSIINGQDVQSAIGSAFTSFGAKGLSETASTFFEDVSTDGLSAAFENSQTQQGMVAGFSMAIGQAMGGNYVQAAFTAAGTAIAGPIGGMIGSLIGSLFGESKPKFQVRGTGATRAIDEGTDLSFDFGLGQLDFAFREIEDEAERTVIDSFQRLVIGIQAAVRNDGILSAMDAVLDDFAVSSRSDGEDLETLLRMYLDDALDAIPSALADAITDLNISIDEQLQMLGDVFTINRQLMRGRGLGLMPSVDVGSSPVLPPSTGPGPSPSPPGLPPRDPYDQQINSMAGSLGEFNAIMSDATMTTDQAANAASGLHPELEQTVMALLDVRIGTEPLIDTFERMVTVLHDLDMATALLGANFGSTREAMIQFGADLVSFFGDDANALGQALDRVLGALYTDTEFAAAAAETASVRLESNLRSLLDQLGMDFDESMMSAEGFRSLFEQLMQSGELTAAQTALLIQAGLDYADLMEANATITQEAADAEAELAEQREEQLGIINGFLADGLAVIDPLRSAHHDLISSYIEARDASIALKQSEREFSLLRMSFNAQLAVLANQLRTSIADLNEQLFGSGNAAQQFGQTLNGAINTAGNAANNMRDQWLRAVDAINDALDSQQFNNSSLTAPERLAEAERQLMEAISAANQGDLGAAQQLPQLFQQAIDQGASFFGTTTADFAEFEARMRAAMEGADLPVPEASPEVQTAQNTSQIAQTVQQQQMTAVEQLQAATRLISQIQTLAEITGQTPAEIAAEYDVSIAQLIGVLTGEVPDLTGDALDSHFNQLADSIANDLNQLSTLEVINTDQLTVLTDIRDLIAQEEPMQFAGPAPEPPAFADGGPVPSTGLATVHRGEYVVPQDGALVKSGSNDQMERRMMNVEMLLERIANQSEAQLKTQRTSFGELIRVSNQKKSPVTGLPERS